MKHILRRVVAPIIVSCWFSTGVDESAIRSGKDLDDDPLEDCKLPQNLPATCNVPIAEHKAKLCHDKLIHYWKDRAKVNMAKMERCRWDPDQGKIVCGANLACKGFRNNYTWKRCEQVAKFDCTECDAETKVLRVPCCSQCSKLLGLAKANALNIRGHPVDDVDCVGCSHKELEAILDDNPDLCETKGDGEFYCDVHDTCAVGQAVIEKQSYDCKMTPCDTCVPNSVAHAQCCARCLDGACNHSSIRMCKGCDIPEEHPAKSLLWLWILLALFGVLVLVAVACGTYRYLQRRAATAIKVPLNLASLPGEVELATNEPPHFEH